MAHKTWSLAPFYVCLAFLVFVNSAFGLVFDNPRTASNSLILRAVTSETQLQRRGNGFKPMHECEHHYVDHSSVLSGTSSRFAKTVMEYKWPALALEDIEHNMIDIQCSHSTITIHVENREVLEYARDAWEGLSAFLIISSHAGCNGDGERAPYLVSGIMYILDSRKVIFSVQKLAWRDAYDSMTVHFGTTIGDYEPSSLRIHQELSRRQAAASSQLSSAASSTLVYPNAVPSSLSTTPPTAVDLGWQATSDKPFYTWSGGDSNLQESIAVSCKTCSISGSAELINGIFTVTSSGTLSSDISVVIGAVKNIFEGGSFTAQVNDLNAHVELQTVLSLSSKHTFDHELVTIPLDGFTIPHILDVGPSFSAHILGSLVIQDDVEFTYGFDVAVPNTSSIGVNFGTCTLSGSSGFDSANVTDIPFNSNTSGITLDLSLGLRAELLLGINIPALNGGTPYGNLDIGVLLDLPSLSVSISQKEGVDAECKNVSSPGSVDGVLSHIFPKLLNIVPQVAIDAALTVGGGVDIDKMYSTSIGAQTTIIGTSWSLSTACMSWDGNSFASPTWSTSTAAATGKPHSKSVGRRGQENPLAGNSAVWWSAGMALGVLSVALSL